MGLLQAANAAVIRTSLMQVVFFMTVGVGVYINVLRNTLSYRYCMVIEKLFIRYPHRAIFLSPPGPHRQHRIPRIDNFSLLTNSADANSGTILFTRNLPVRPDHPDAKRTLGDPLPF